MSQMCVFPVKCSNCGEVFAWYDRYPRLEYRLCWKCLQKLDDAINNIVESNPPVKGLLAVPGTTHQE
jgi:hypothetical protein